MIKKILVVLLVSLSSQCFAISTANWISSHTATADTLGVPCTKYASNLDPNALLNAVCVNTGVAGSFTVYNSSGGAVNTMAIIDTSTKGCQTYNVELSSGLTYTNSATADITMLFQCF